MIMQSQLEVIEALEIRISTAKSDLKKLLAEHEVVAAPIEAALLRPRPETIECGPLSASIGWDKKRSPSYKGWIVEHHGEDVAQGILDATPEVETPYLVVEPAASQRLHQIKKVSK